MCNISKTEVLQFASQDELEQQGTEWSFQRVADLSTVLLALAGTLTLGIATGPSSAVEAQLSSEPARSWTQPRRQRGRT